MLTTDKTHVTNYPAQIDWHAMDSFRMSVLITYIEETQDDDQLESLFAYLAGRYDYFDLPVKSHVEFCKSEAGWEVIGAHHSVVPHTDLVTEYDLQRLGLPSGQSDQLALQNFLNIKAVDVELDDDA